MSKGTKDYDRIASISQNLSSVKDYQKKLEKWRDSPFSTILSLPSRTKGKIGEEIISDYLSEKGCDIQRANNSSYDRLINGYKCEIKFSTLWKDAKHYVFQQVRNTNWDYLLCLGICPHEAHLWYAKPNIFHILPGQHKGRDALDTKWIHISPHGQNPYPEHLLGGELSKGTGMFLKEIGR